MKIQQIIAVLILVTVGILYFLYPGIFSNTSLEEYADQVIETCSDKNYRPPCYDVEIPKLTKYGLSMEEMFEVTTYIQDKSQDYWYCHVLGHNLSSQEAAKDLDNWIDVVSRCPIGMCSNGCLHGTFQEKFKDAVLTDEEIDELMPDFNTICEPGDTRNFTGLERASCYHALGHLTMYITNADIEKSTEICTKVADKGTHNYFQTCYEGAYMQLFQPLEPEDFVLVEEIAPRTTEEAIEYCNQFSGEKKSACQRESWPLWGDKLFTSEGIQNFCSQADTFEDKGRCYNALFYIMTPRMQFDPTRISELCNGMPSERKGQCYGNSASRHLETDYRLSEDAVKLCAIAEENGVGGRCYGELIHYSVFNFHPDSEGFNTLCNALPSPWNQKCFDKEGYSIARPTDF